MQLQQLGGDGDEKPLLSNSTEEEVAKDEEDSTLPTEDKCSNRLSEWELYFCNTKQYLFWREEIVTGFWVLVNIIVVVGIVFVNKWITSHYSDSGIVMTLVHTWTTCVAMTGVEVTGAFKAKAIPYREVFILALLNSLAIVTSNLSIQYSPVTIYQIFKILMVPMVAFLQKIIWPSSVVMGNATSLVVITFGGILSVATHSESSVTALSIFINVASTTISSLFQVITAKKMEDLQVTPNQLLYLQSPVNCIILLVLMYFFEIGSFLKVSSSPGFLFVLLAGSILAPLVNLSMTFVIQRTSPLTYSVVSQLKSLCIFFGSIFVLQEYPTVQSVVGLIILQAGVIWYLHSKLHKSSAAPNSPKIAPTSPPPPSPALISIKRNWTVVQDYAMYQKNRLLAGNRLLIVVALLFPVFLFIFPPHIPIPGPPDTPNYHVVPDLYIPAPRIVHYVWANENQTTKFKLSTYLSVVASYNYLKPDKIYWHYSPTNNFTGYWWDKMKPLLTLNPIEIPSDIFGKTPIYIEHKADLVRLQIIKKYGGVYFDTDIIPLRSFDDLFMEGKTVLGAQTIYTIEPNMAICNAFILAPPNASFVNLWLNDYKVNFQPECWACNSGANSGYLTWKYPNLVHVLDRQILFNPSFDECDKMLVNYTANVIENNYAVHLWNAACNVSKYSVDPEMVRAANSTYTHIALPFLEESYLAALDNCAKTNTTCPYIKAAKHDY